MENNEQKIYDLAVKRVAFKRHLKLYLAITAFTWLIWYFISIQEGRHDGYWPIFSTFGWGFGVLMHYWSVYHDKGSAIDKEIEKLKKKP